MALDFDTSAEDIKVFLDEAEDLLQMLEGGILKLEKDADHQDTLAEIFRAAHTLKGSSATLGHKRMAELTHSMENVLDKLRKGKLQITTAVVDTLFSCLDVLKAYKQEIATGEESDVDASRVMAELAVASEDGARPVQTAEASPAATAGASLPAGIPPLLPEEQAKMVAGTPRGLLPAWAAFAIDKNAPMPAVRAFQAILAVSEVGELVRSWPSQEEVEADKVGDELKILFTTDQKIERIQSVFGGIPDLRILELTPLVAPEPAAQVPASTTQAAAAALAAPSLSVNGSNGLQGAVAPAQGAERPFGQNGKTAAVKSSSRTVRVDVEVLDNLMSLVGELVIERTRLLQVLTQLETARDGDELTQVMASALTHVGRLSGDLQEEIQRARMLPVDNLFKKFPRMVRDTAQKAGKEIEFVVLGEETELDRSVIEEIGDPLMHLLRNAVDHGVEPPMDRVRSGKAAKGTVTLEAFHEENHIIISVRDDGRGMDPAKLRAAAVRKGLLSEDAARRLTDYEALSLVWMPGFSTAEKVSEVSGRGVGLDVVHKNIEKLNGQVEIRTEIGKGTEFRVKLPLTLAIIRALQVEVLSTTYCMPLGSVVETDRIPTSEIQTVRQREVIVKRGEVIPLVRLVDAFLLERPEGFEEPEEIFVVIVSVQGRQIGIVVDNLIGEGDIVIKPLGKFIGDVPGISGATIMGDGDVAIILDISSLMNTVQAEINREVIRA